MRMFVGRFMPIAMHTANRFAGLSALAAAQDLRLAEEPHKIRRAFGDECTPPACSVVLLHNFDDPRFAKISVCLNIEE